MSMIQLEVGRVKKTVSICSRSSSYRGWSKYRGNDDIMYNHRFNIVAHITSGITVDYIITL